MIRRNYGEGPLIGERNPNVGRPPAKPPFTGGQQQKESGCLFRAATLFLRICLRYFFSLFSSIRRRKQLFPAGSLRFQRFSLRIAADALCVHTTIHPTTSWLLYRPAQAG